MTNELDTRRSYLEITAISFVILFQELALIRWLPSQVRVLSYFPNVVLISAFLGLGVGCLLASRRVLVGLWPIGVVVAALGAWLMSGIASSPSRTTNRFSPASPSRKRYAPAAKVAVGSELTMAAISA